jgi:D-glycero-beta-D-manno-heptose-7-phosphate kinase
MNLEAIFDSFNAMKVAIVGDVMIDSYVMGKVHRMSPEAPVPVLLLDKEEHRLGGAANVALNLKALGAEVYLCSVIGTDTAATKFQHLLDRSKDSKSRNHSIGRQKNYGKNKGFVGITTCITHRSRRYE